MNAINEITKSLNVVEKMLPMVQEEITSPDDKTMISNIIDMLKQILGAGQTLPETMPETEVMEQLADSSEDMEIEKEKTPSARTGDEDADTRLEDQTPVSENAMQEIGKSLSDIKTLLSGKAVQKSTVQRNTKTDAIADGLKRVVEVVKAMASRQKQQEDFMGKFMNEIGISDDIVKKAIVPEPSQSHPTGRPEQQADMMAFMTEFMKSINKENRTSPGNSWPTNPQNNPWTEKTDVRKDLDGVLDFLHTK